MMCCSPIYLKKVRLFVPCGKCGNCLQRRISDYVCRLQVEHRHSKRSYFVTLTYERDPLQLYKKDLQSFFKRLRKVGAKFSYFALGDYGDTFGRPHYHVCFFVKGFFPVQYLHSLWISGDQTRKRGFVNTRALVGGRIAYVVRYGYLAKLDWDKSDGRKPPFFLMSKRPALGSQYLTGNMARFHRRSNVWYFPDGKFKRPLPRYFRDKLFSKPLREAHADEVLALSAERREVALSVLARKSVNPLKLYYDTLENGSRLFLEDLRERKRLKNKLL